jgi:PadR family transcriptional regulator, regulatory protein PadR
MEAPLSARTALVQALYVSGYGIDLIERVRRTTYGRVRLSMGSIYPALRRLQREGFVVSRLVRARPGPGRPRRYFELTPRGVAVRDAERRALAALFRVEDHRIPRESPRLIGERLRRCSSTSTSALSLRRRVLEEQGGA